MSKQREDQVHMRLKGQIGLVTGASSGIGREVAIQLGRQGVELCLVGRRKSVLEEVQAKIRAENGRAEVFSVDLTVDSDIQSLHRFVEDRFGRLDLLIHSAGVFDLGPIEHSSAAVLDEQYRGNVRAPFLLTQAVLELLKQRHGQIVFMNSTAGLEARANVSSYAASKHALRAISESLRAEVNPAGVRILNLYLGRTATPMQEVVCQKEGRPYKPENFLQPEDVASLLVSTLLLPDTAEVTEIRIRPAAKTY